MIPSADLRAEVLERLRELNAERPGKSWTASHVANQGEKRSVTAVWNQLERLDEERLVDQTTPDGFRLRVEWTPAPDQISLDVGA